MADLDIPDKLFFRIGETAELVGVEPHVLRYWESEFRMRPQRSASGQRMYRRKDIERFMRIRTLVHQQGFTIAGARKALQSPSRGAVIQDTARIAEAIRRIESARGRIDGLRDRLLNVPLTELRGKH
ncbi:MAG: DNA-binding transcriptional MerR regulator [Kiritimatiellia bacterium]